MMICIVKNRPSLFNHKNGAFSYVVHLSSSSSASKIQDPSLKSSPMAEFLIKSCGLSPQRAASASKVISKVTTTKQADSVRHFLKQHGFDDTHIRKAISSYPTILSVNVERTLQPNLQTLSNFGFVQAEIQALISSNAFIVVNPSLAIPRLQFWENFLGTSSKIDLAKAVVRNRSLLCLDIVSCVAPKISLLKKHGFSDANIANLVMKGRNVITRSQKTIEALLKRSKEIGFDMKSSLMISQGLSSLGSMRREALAKKMEFFKGFGWSEQECFDVFKKTPYVFHLKEESIQEKVEFIVSRVGLNQSYIASHALLLAYSLEKRLKPRHNLMEMLKEKKLVARDLDLLNIICLGEKKFVEKYIVPYEKKVPKIHEIYAATSTSQINFK